MQLSSLSEMDVRSLKTLYDTRTQAPASPNISAFSIDAFAQRVQALISDDRALIERLIRFAQAHDLLKKNAERAQKLAQDANNALETYQKQVRTLEERNMTLTAQQAALYVYCIPAESPFSLLTVSNIGRTKFKDFKTSSRGYGQRNWRSSHWQQNRPRHVANSPMRITLSVRRP